MTAKVGGRKKASSQVVVPAASAAWEFWRRLTPQFKTSRLLASAFRSGSALGIYGVDCVSSLRDSRMAQAAEAVVSQASDDELATLIEIAEVNAARNDSMWRMAVVFYVSVPGALLFASLDAAPDVIRELIRDSLGYLAILFAVFTGQMLYYFGTFWRARQIVAVLELLRIERGRTGRDVR